MMAAAGDSDVRLVEALDHAATYHRFMLGVKWLSIHLAAVLVFLILWFAAGAGFLAGLVGGLAVFAAGAYAMAHGLAQSSEGETLAGAQRDTPSRSS